MEINWQVDDGYVGAGSQSFDIDDDEIKNCETVEEAMRLIEDYTETEFQNKVRWCFYGYDSMKEEVEQLIAERNKEEESKENEK